MFRLLCSSSRSFYPLSSLFLHFPLLCRCVPLSPQCSTEDLYLDRGTKGERESRERTRRTRRETRLLFLSSRSECRYLLFRNGYLKLNTSIFSIYQSIWPAASRQRRGGKGGHVGGGGKEGASLDLLLAQMIASSSLLCGYMST